MNLKKSSHKEQAHTATRMHLLERVFADIIMCIRFYSRLPSGPQPHETPNLTRMAAVLGAASVVMGIAPALILMVAPLINIPAWVVAIMAIGMNTIVTGAMAEDAIADSFDGLFGGHTIERRLEIMKDSRIGAFGVTALFSFLLWRVAALVTLIEFLPLAAAGLWLGSSILARSGALGLTMVLPSARSGGASSTAGRVNPPHYYFGLAVAIALALALTLSFLPLWALVIAIGLQVLIGFTWYLVCKHKIAGQTGDILGALQGLLEIAALTTFIVFAGPLG